MERLLTYENFEIEVNKNNNISGKKEKQSHSYAKIILLLI